MDGLLAMALSSANYTINDSAGGRRAQDVSFQPGASSRGADPLQAGRGQDTMLAVSNSRS
jgi:hypothetical protein